MCRSNLSTKPKSPIPTSCDLKALTHLRPVFMRPPSGQTEGKIGLNFSVGKQLSRMWLAPRSRVELECFVMMLKEIVIDRLILWAWWYALMSIMVSVQSSSPVEGTKWDCLQHLLFVSTDKAVMHGRACQNLFKNLLQEHSAIRWGKNQQQCVLCHGGTLGVIYVMV